MGRSVPEDLDQPRGQGMVEYGLMVGLVAILVIASFVVLGPQITSQFQQTFDEQSVGESQASISSAIYARN